MDRNSFIENIKVDKATIDRYNEVSRNAAKKANTQTGRKSGLDDGGCERGDTGSGSLGHESGNKGISSAQSANNEGQSTSGQGASGQGLGDQGTGGGQGGGGQGAGGHGGH